MALARGLCLVWLASLFAYTGMSKLYGYRASKGALVRYANVPRWLGEPGAALLPLTEFGIGVSLLALPHLRLVGLAPAGMGIIFMTLGTRNWSQRSDVPCGCTGSAQTPRRGRAMARRHQTVVARGALIVAASLILVLVSDTAADSWAVLLGILLATGLILQFHIAWSRARRSRRRLEEQRRRETEALSEVLHAYDKISNGRFDGGTCAKLREAR